MRAEPDAHAEVPAWVRAFIEASKWTEAQSRDHEYTVKGKTAPDVKAFERLVDFIREHGYAEVFAGREYDYLVVGEHRYWTMGFAASETVILNRARLDGPGQMNLTEDDR